MNGITYYRLKSDYTGDYTKNCALNGTEVDNNFYVLEGRDVKSIAVKGKDIVLTLMDGSHLSAEGALDFVKPEDVKTSIVKVEFDSLNGVLKLTNADGTIQHIEGFSTNENTDFSVSTDNTLWGDGLRNKPLGVAPSSRTGQYKTVKSFVDITKNESLPTNGNVLGDRYVTCEDISDYGYLYDYRAVREIACELKKTGWRIPTKADWDDLLNAIEPCECDKNHDKADKNKFLGKWAGKLLKSKTMWKNGCCSDSCGECGCDCDCDDCCKPKKHDCGCERDCACGDDVCFDYSDDPCVGTKESSSECKCEKGCDDHKGLDAFGFRVTPAGYADDGCNFGYFKERAAFWTATTNEDNTKAYIKRFQYNKDGVYQDVIASNFHLSLRLVKDYDGKNYFDVEEIMDMDYPTLLLPSVAHGKSIWMSANLACGNASLSPMLPNNGQSITFTRHYFINEWNGFKWVRNEMKQGESVVIAKAPKGKEMVEYRVVGNDFVSVNEMIYTDVKEDIKPLVDEEAETRKDTDEKLQEAIIKEIQDRTEADDKLRDAIDEEATQRQMNDEMLQVNIDNEAEERKAADEAEAKAREEKDTELGNTIKTVNDNLVTAINTINNNVAEGFKTINENVANGFNTINAAIEAERVIREEADKAEEEARKKKDTELEEAVNAEAKTREEADVKLEDAIDEEITKRQMTDEMLQSNIDAEEEARIAADEAEAKTREDADNTEAAARAKADEDEKAARIADDEKEAKTRAEKDKEIEGKLLTKEGTEFDSKTGELTLKSAAGTNDVKVQFSFNFGEF